MISVRLGTWETNSSSCHSVTTMESSIWEKFKKNEIFFNKDFWDIECHASTSTFINDDNVNEVIMLVDKVYDLFVERLNSCKDELARQYKVDDNLNRFNRYVLNWVCKNLSKESFLNWIQSKNKVLDKIDPPVSVYYGWRPDNEPTIYDMLTGEDVIYFIYSIFEKTEDSPYRFPYYYGDISGWETASVYGNTPKAIDIYVPGHFIKEGIKVSEGVSFQVIDDEIIRISLDGSSKVVIEREENC